MGTQTVSVYEHTIDLLNEFRFPVHRIGCKQLRIAIPMYAEDSTQCLTKNIYPHIGKVLNCSDWRAVEHSIRDVIVCAWENGDRAAWDKYFPEYKKPPSNKVFIATIAEYARKKSLPEGRG